MKTKGLSRPDKNYMKSTLSDISFDGYSPAYEDLWVTPDGEVRRVKIWEDEVYYKDLSQSLSNAKYWQVGKSSGGAIPVHVLVALAYLGVRPEGCDVNHINRHHEDKADNFILNLEWLDKSKNRSSKYFCKQ